MVANVARMWRPTARRMNPKPQLTLRSQTARTWCAAGMTAAVFIAEPSG